MMTEDFHFQPDAATDNEKLDEKYKPIDEQEAYEIEAVEDVLNDLSDLKTRFSSKEINVLVKDVQSGNQASKQDLINKFDLVIKRLIINKAQPELEKIHGDDFSRGRQYEEMMQDLLQEGRIAVLESTDDYDPQMQKTPFYTRAYIAILRSFMGYIYKNAGVMALPVTAGEQLEQAKRGEHPHSQANNDNYRHAMDKDRQAFSPRWFYLVENILQPVSLGSEDNRELMRFTLDGPTTDPGRGMAIRQNITEAFEQLRGRELQVMRLRFGFDDGEMKDLEQIVKITGMTKDRVRQIESNALLKLRRALVSK